MKSKTNHFDPFQGVAKKRSSVRLGRLGCDLLVGLVVDAVEDRAVVDLHVLRVAAELEFGLVVCRIW